MDDALSPNNPATLKPSRFRSRAIRGTSLVALLAVGALALGAAEWSPQALAQLKPGPAALEGRAPLSFADIVEKVKPAVVSISVTNGGDAKTARRGPKGGRGFEGLPDLPDDNPFSEFFKNLPKEFRNPPQQQRPTMAQGSGFVISADGYVVTNNHVIDGANKIQVSFDENNKFEAELVGTDSRTDVALLKIKADKSFPFVKFAEKPTRVGDWVIAVGNPFGLGGTVTAGILSALGRDIGSGPYDYLQIDAAVNRGNSGGPTFNLEGEVIGVNTAIYSPSGGNVGIAFAVPAKTALEVVDQLKAHGSVSRGWLGVKIQDVDEDTAAGIGLSEAKGALVSEVTANGPALAAGLKARDAIVEVNKEKIADSRDLARKIAELAPSTTVDVKIWRDGADQVVKVKLGKFPGSLEELAKAEESGPGAGTELEQLGLTLASPRPGTPTEGVAITDVDPDSDAAQKGLKAGDMILDIGGQAVTSADDVAAGIKRAKDQGRKAVLLSIKSADQKRIVALPIKKS